MTKRINFKVHLPGWVNSIYPDALWRITTEEKAVYLTFDDGPVPVVTPAILTLLKEQNIVATFFCVGDNVSKYPEIYKQIIDEGHAIGNHTYNHLNGLKNKNKDYFSNIERAAGLIHSNLFRPPYGLLKKSQYRKLINRYKIVLWDVISCDYDPTLSPEQVYSNVMDFVRDGSIISFHDSNKAEKNILTVLPKIIDQLKKEGYVFKKIEFKSSEPENGHLDRKQFNLLHTLNNKIRERA